MRYIIWLLVLALFVVIFLHGQIFNPLAWGGLLLEFLPFVILVVGIGSVVGLVQKRTELRRDREYELFSTERGFYYLAAPAGDQYGFDAFWLFKQGWGARLRHDISGTYGGHPFRAFEYAYYTGGGPLDAPARPGGDGVGHRRSPAPGIHAASRICLRWPPPDRWWI